MSAPALVVLSNDGDRLIGIFDADRNLHISGVGQLDPGRNIASLAQSTSPFHIDPANINGTSCRCRTCNSCQIIMDSRTVPIPPGTTMKASDMSKWSRWVRAEPNTVTR